MSSPHLSERDSPTPDSPTPDRAKLSQYAEYQDSAPEYTPSTRAIEHENPAPERAILYAEDLDGAPQAGFVEKYDALPEVVVPTDETSLPLGEKKRRFCGLTLRWAIILGVVVILLIIGIVVGVVVGTRSKDKSDASPSSTSSSPSSTHSASASSTATALKVLNANYGTNVVTDEVETCFKGANLVIDMTNTSHTAWNANDPASSTRKCLSVLHSYGDSLRTFVGCEGDGMMSLKPGKVSESNKTQEITGYSSPLTDFKIISIVWGSAEVRNRTVYTTVYELKKNGSNFAMDSDFFGWDSLPGYKKSGIIWYTTDDSKTFGNLYGWEGAQLGFNNGA